ncbi:cation transporter [Rothia halotolerans]|uniref:cation transporter n=1 Tax=Rothia halotolerans TaxID=405770 RepID=UPI00101D4611|nr:cation transporter [Rothia halotolerans]
MSPAPRFGITELPEKQARVLRRAIRLERIDLCFRAVTVVLMITVAGNSQAMKAAWIEDALSFLPPLSFLLAVRIIRRRPSRRHPYGYHRSVGVAHLVASVCLLTMGLYLLIESGLGLVEAEHPAIGVVSLLGHPVWLGWLMIPAALLTGIPTMILGRMKLKLAPDLHDKVLFADADMNKADWMTSLTTVIGILGIGIGWWWTDSVAAIIISGSIIRDGWGNLRSCIADLMDVRATTYDSSEPHPIIGEIKEELRRRDWVEEADCRVRDQGHVFHVEAFVVPRGGRTPSLEELAAAREACVELDWKMQDMVLVPVEKLPEEFLPRG